MSIDTVTPRTRRAILGAALGGVAAAVAGALGRPQAAEATDNQALLLGVNSQTSTKVTGITSTSSIALAAETTSGTAIYGRATLGGAFYGESASVGGATTTSVNFADSGRAPGVDGTSFAVGGIGVFGNAYGSGSGVVGRSTSNSHEAITIPAKTGVYGYAIQDGGSRGVFGQTTSGQGVRGEATTGVGVYAGATAGGTALSVNGRATFTRSGRASVAANKRSVDITVPGGLAPTTLVVATLETYRSGVWVTVARKNYPANGVVRIYLNKIASTTSSTVIGWIAIN